MEKVLMIPAPVLSHINASFKIANLLKRHRYQVHYFVYHAVTPVIAQAQFGFTPANTPPIMEGYRKALAKHEKKRVGYWSFLRNGGLRPFFNERRKELLEVVEKTRPNLIIADSFAAADFAFLYPLIKRYGIRFVQLETLPCTLSLKGLPAFSSMTLPSQKGKIWFEYYMRKGVKKLSRLGGRVMYAGTDAYSLIKKELKKNKVPAQYRIEPNNYFSLTFRGLPTLLPLPLELEFFTAPPTPHHHYLGFLDTGSSQMGAVAESRLEKLLQTGKPVIYISFGTVFSGIWHQLIVTFLQKLDAVLANFKEVVAIFSLGSPQGAAKAVMMQFNHIHTFAYVPQSYLLRFCSVFITHGGINSIKESIQAAVPMLVVPLEVDQPGNAAKIVHKGLGLAGHILTESVEGLAAKLTALLYEGGYKEQLQQFREKISKDNHAEEKLMHLIAKEGLVQ